MKILIVATPRTGSSEMACRIGTYLGLKIYHEPFNPLRPEELQYDQIPDNCLVKCLIDQVPNGQPMLTFYQDFIRYFDKVTILARRNLTEQIESWNWLCTKRNNNQPYVYTRQPNYEENEKYITRVNSAIKHLSNNVGIPILYYEDAYRNDSIKFRVSGPDQNI